MERKRMMYKGPSRDLKYNPWLRLIHGKRYDMETHKTTSGKYRVTVIEGFDRVRISYDSKKEFEKEWCK